MFLNRIERAVYLWRKGAMFCAHNQGAREDEKTVAVVGDFGKTREIFRIMGSFQSCRTSSQNKEYSLVLCEGSKFVTVIDVFEMSEPEKVVDRCSIVFGIVGSSSKLLSFWREQTKETGCFFELLNLCDLEERLEAL
ncbi:conserved hypothetical protein [Lausannevirus]|uniref:Uncharacterized protein n=2 Tax=Lausannevirus TaxID=999883 RepID=A0A0N9P941_9VIRU|nr:hypothetical protein LAU_0377 [Lausannevirus]AEA07227.1 conserved hypothetical protein [Lausannevirus]ALH07039.1 hypothetical protein PMV_341 [Port-miou virus]